MTAPTARELLIKAVTMDLGFFHQGCQTPTFQEAMASLEESTPLQRLGYAAQGLRMWGQIVEVLTEEMVQNGGRMPPGKEDKAAMVTGGRECLAVFCEAYAATLRELAP